MKNIVILVASAFFFTSCIDKGDIAVTNKVGNAMLENISFDDKGLHPGVLLPGETSGKTRFDSNMKGISFPFSGQVSFYMRAKGNAVYLKTEEIFTLKKDGYLKVEITADTKVINPLTTDTRGSGGGITLRELLDEE